LVGYLELGHQWIAGTGVPLLSSGVDDTRFSAPGGPSIVLTDLLSVATIVALAVPRRLDSPDARFELAVAAIATFGFMLGGGRVTVVLSLISAFVARSLYWGLPSRRAMALGAVGIACFVVAAFYLRSSQNLDNLLEREFYGEVLPGVPFLLRPLVPLYIGLTTNFQVLASVVDYFPDSAAYGHGLYNAAGADLVISDARSLPDVAGMLTSPWVTATVAGTLWADGGLPLVVVGVGLTAALSVAAYEYARLARSLTASMIAGVLFYHAIFGVYTNLWTQHLDWILICLLLVPAGAIARDPNWPSGPLKRLAEWIRWRSADNLPAWRGRSPPE
jgi:oligosaccharide repeat unit polymerase